MLTVRKLREFLASLPAEAEDAVFVTSAPDHEYEKASIRYTTALVHKGKRDTTLYEDYGDGAKLDPKDDRIKVILVT